MDEIRCCICNKLICHYNINNAEPYRRGLCCDSCYHIYVVPYKVGNTDVREVRASGTK